MSNRIYIGLLHYPVYNKTGEVAASSITNHDLHDLARLCVTYGLNGYFVVTPLELQRKLGERLIAHWVTGPGADYNWTRKEAFKLARMASDLAEVKARIEDECGKPARLVGTSAKKMEKQVSFGEMRKRLAKETEGVWLIIFGTGWGLERGFMEREFDYLLEPIRGSGDYNHLSVRSAAAIILDRLFSVDSTDE